jgi:signal transduction histidine kinase
MENLRGLASVFMGQLELCLTSIRTAAELNNTKSSADNASLVKTGFVSSILCHELPAPLNSILGYAQLLQLGAPSLASSHCPALMKFLKQDGISQS